LHPASFASPRSARQQVKPSIGPRSKDSIAQARPEFANHFTPELALFTVFALLPFLSIRLALPHYI
jgi:hypothetical protein